MALGNFTPFRAKHVTSFQFGATAWTAANMDSSTVALDSSFDTNHGEGILVDLVGTADAVNPTQSYAFAKDFTVSGNERTVSEEALLGADEFGSQNTELAAGNNSKMEVETTVVYRNPSTTKIFNDSTKCCLIEMDNDETSTTGLLNLAFNNLTVMHVGSLSRNSDGLMEQKIKFTVRGGFASTATTVSQTSPTTETWVRYHVGPDYAEEIRTA